MGCHFLLQRIFPTQGSNPRLLCPLHCRRVLYPLRHQGSPQNLCDELSKYWPGRKNREDPVELLSTLSVENTLQPSRPFLSSKGTFLVGLSKESACKARDLGSIPGEGRFPQRREWQPTPVYSCLENPMDREPWQAAVHVVTKSRTKLSDYLFHFQGSKRQI